MSTLELQVYDIFRVKLGEVEASKVIEFIDFKTNAKVEVKAEIFEQIKKDIEKLEGRLDTKISETKSEILKWMFVFWASQIGATIGFLMIYLKRPV